MRETDAQRRATEFVKELYAAVVIQSLPAPVAPTSPDQQLTGPLEVHGGLGRRRHAVPPCSGHIHGKLGPMTHHQEPGDAAKAGPR
jgi:hypothetical protein